MSEQRLRLPSWWSAVPLELTYQELVGLWGAADVYRPDATLVEQLSLPADAPADIESCPARPQVFRRSDSTKSFGRPA
jgi:hypothetical protein